MKAMTYTSLTKPPPSSTTAAQIPNQARTPVLKSSLIIFSSSLCSPRVHPSRHHRWEHKVIQAIQTADGTYILLFEKQPKATAFYLVTGCDGAWSKIHSPFPRRHLIILEYPQLRSITATFLLGIPRHLPSLVPAPSSVSTVPKYYAVIATETAPAHTQCYPPSHGP